MFTVPADRTRNPLRIGEQRFLYIGRPQGIRSIEKRTKAEILEDECVLHCLRVHGRSWSGALPVEGDAQPETERPMDADHSADALGRTHCDDPVSGSFGEVLLPG